MKPQAAAQVEAIEFEETEFVETPTTLVMEAIQEYQENQSQFNSDDEYSSASSWSFLAHHVVGHEVGV